MTQWTAILAALIAFLAWLLQRALNRADEQRRVASRMRSYLVYWQRCALNMDGAGLLAMGQEWYEEERKVYRAGGDRGEIAKKLVEIDNKYQSDIAKQLKAELSGNAPLSPKLQEMRTTFAKYQKARDETIGHLYQLRKELIEGHTFVRDGDLAVLDVPTVQAAVELRMTLGGLLADFVSLLQSIEALDGQDFDESAQKLTINAAIAGIRVSHHIKYLMVRCEYYLRRKRLDAVQENLGV